MMKRVLSIGFVFILCLASVEAQDTGLLDKMYGNISSSCVEMEYSFSTRVSGVNTNGSGVLRAQDGMWSMQGNGVQMWCDGRSVWIVDPAQKEVVIETVAAESETEFMTNPAAFIMTLEETFQVVVSHLTEDGLAMFYSLVPKASGIIEHFNIEILRGDASVRRSSFAMKSGDLIKIEVSSMRLTPKVSDEDFRPQMKFDSTWIVTDMR